MDSVVSQLLARQLGLSEEDYNALQSSDPSSVIASQISDPLIVALLNVMLHQQNTDQQEEEKDYEEILNRAKQIIRKQKEQIATLSTMLNYISKVFGACPVCWGKSNKCSRCNGKGMPGSRQPLEEELLNWVEPALQRLGMQVIKS